MKSNLRLFMLFLLSLTATTMSAEEYSYEFTKKIFSSDGTYSLSNIDWTVRAPGAGYWGFSDKGQQIGSKAYPAESVILSTTGIQGKVSKITVETSGASGTQATLEVTVGGSAYGSAYALTTTSTTVEFTGNSAGEIKLNFALGNDGKALYIKAIKITYGEGGSPGGTPEEIVTVNSIAEFNALPDGKEATLYLSDEIQAHVTYVYGQNAYLRDATGAICFYDFVKVPTMTYNQHVAGYITGVKSTVGNMPVLVATERTNTARLVIAAPVTEPNVEPVVITAAEQGSHYADWVTIKNVKMTDEFQGKDATGKVNVVNTFRTSQYTNVQAGSSYDISGIVNSTKSSGDRFSPVYNVTSAREGNPAANMNAEFQPLTTATGISQILTDRQNGTVIYDIMGRRVSMAQMTKGVYIMNGKKYIK